MARIRTIKPEFFTSEDIVSLSPLARLLYIATWCEADKEGRLVWKPMTFKLRYFPGDACDIHAMCKELVDAKLVVLYGDGLAVIPKFSAHQHVNPRESASVLPEPKAARVSTRSDASARVNSEIDPQVGREGKGKEGNIEAKASSVAFAPPEWVPAEPWTDFVKNRKAMRNVPFTEAASKGVIAELKKLVDQGYDAAELLQAAVTNGWRTVYPPKNKVIGMTVPSPPGRDPALQKMDDDARITKPPSLAVLQRLAEIRNGAAA